ncbi:hydrophobin [Moniliophthora roreri]|nr:hydrophobin [Moniliophthora roreri]
MVSTTYSFLRNNSRWMFRASGRRHDVEKGLKKPPCFDQDSSLEQPAVVVQAPLIFSNMQFKLFSLAALATLAAATPTPRAECNTGPIECCNTVTNADDPAAASVLGLLGIIIQDLNVVVGLTCSPVTVIGAGGSGWLVFTVPDIIPEIDRGFIAMPTLFAAKTTLTVGF